MPPAAPAAPFHATSLFEVAAKPSRPTPLFPSAPALHLIIADACCAIWFETL